MRPDAAEEEEEETAAEEVEKETGLERKVGGVRWPVETAAAAKQGLTRAPVVPA